MDINDEWFGVPQDVRNDIYSLLQTSYSLERMCMTRKQERALVLPTIKSIRINAEAGHGKPSRFLGCNPTSMQIEVMPTTEEEFVILATLLSSVQTLKVLVTTELDYIEQFVHIIGPSLANVTSYTSAPIFFPDRFLELCAPFLTNVRDLRIGWIEPDSMATLKAISQHVPKFRNLQIEAGFEPEDTIDFNAMLDCISQAEKVVVPSKCFVEVGTTQDVLDSLTKKCGESMQNLYVSTDDGDQQIGFVIPLYGYLFATTEDEELSASYLKKLAALGVNHTIEGGDTTLAYLMGLEAGQNTATKIRRLLEIAASVRSDGSAPVNDCIGPGTENVLHRAIKISSGAVATLLCQFLDWSALSSIEDLRLNGCLPIHFPAVDSDAWLTVYNHMKKRFPDVDLLADETSFEGWPPVHSILNHHHGVSPDSLSAILAFILHEKPQSASAVTRDKVPLLWRALYAFRCDSPFDVQTESAIPSLESIATALFGDLTKLSGCSLRKWGFPPALFNATEPEEHLLGQALATCALYLPTVFNAVAQHETSSVRTACLLRLFSCRRSDAPAIFGAIETLIDLGVDDHAPPRDHFCNSSREELENTALKFLSSFWKFNQFNNNIDIFNFVSTTDDFHQEVSNGLWNCFWRLVERFPPTVESTPFLLMAFDMAGPHSAELILFSESTNVEKFITLCARHYPTIYRSIHKALVHLDSIDVTRPKSRFEDLLLFSQQASSM